MDGDVQHPPAVVRDLVAVANGGATGDAGTDLVVASRYASSGNAGGLSGWWRTAVSY